jgi:hypothetical protein
MCPKQRWYQESRMSQRSRRTLTGWVIWLVLAAVIGSCVVPGSAFAGVLSAHTEPAIAITGRWICPAGTTPIRHDRETTSRDRYGEHRSTAHELHCRDTDGTIVLRDPFSYVVLWLGLAALVGVTVTLLSVVIAGVPGAWLINRRIDASGTR